MDVRPPLRLEVGEVVRLKKRHPCGSFDWEVIRTGVDIGLICRGCGHRILMPRLKLEKAIRLRLGGDGSAP